ncbi:MAG: DUF4369 domain-containing protein [Bacteroidaceae bacterium]|nr:DUF4369 domain-containing protein [Bacteroidaceae bacterium]
MKNLAYIAISFALLCCTGHPKEVRLEGEFANLEQGEFLIYSTDEALDRLDTLRIVDGIFSYTLPTVQPATLHILYPNQSELVVFAGPGDDIVIKGDAQNLSEVEVSGSEDNELYTEFRQETNGKSAEETKNIAHNYILEYPTHAVSRYLFTTYYLCDEEASVKETTALYDSLCRACPDDLALSKLSSRVRSLGLLRVGNPLPDFSLTLKPGHGGNGAEQRIIKKGDYNGKLLLIAFWANWKGGSAGAIYRARRLRRELKGRGKDIELISYSLDADESQLYRNEERDSIDFPSYCDFLSLSSPLVQKWGIRELPYIILVTPDGNIAASGSDWMTDIQPVASEL